MQILNFTHSIEEITHQTLQQFCYSTLMQQGYIRGREFVEISRKYFARDQSPDWASFIFAMLMVGGGGATSGTELVVTAVIV